jgi:hypothetical protein
METSIGGILFPVNVRCDPMRRLATECRRMVQMKMLYLLHSVLKGIQQWIAAVWPI